MGTFQKLMDVIGTVGAKYALLGGLYFVAVGLVVVPIFGKKLLKNKVDGILKTAVSCILFGLAFIIIGAFLCMGFTDDGLHSFQMAFIEILPIFLIGIVLLLMVLIALSAYWSIFKVDAGEKEKETNNKDK